MDFDIQAMGAVLDTKIDQINQLRLTLSKQIHQINQAVKYKQSLNTWMNNFDMLVRELKRAYTFLGHVPSIVQNSQLYSLYVIEQIQAKYHEELIKIKYKYQTEINELNAEIQNEFKIRKTLKDEVEELKKYVEKFVKSQSVVTTSSTTPTKNCQRNLQIINQEDQLVNDHRQTEQQVDKYVYEKNKNEKKLNLEILQRKMELKNSSMSPKFLLQQFKKSIKSCILNKSSDKISSNNCTEVFQSSYENVTEEYEQCKTVSHPTTPKGYLAKPAFGRQRQFFSQINSQNNSQKKVDKSKEKLSTEQQILKKELSYLSVHLKKKTLDKQKSKSKEKSLPKSKQKVAPKVPVEIIQKFKQHKRPAKEHKYTEIIKNYLIAKQNSKESLKNHTFCVGQKKEELKYEGGKRDGKKNGSGILFYSNGLSYEGTFKDNNRQGYGVLKFNNIQIYNGEWDRDMIQGKGRIKNCSVIFKKKRDSDTVLSKWACYSGEFKENKFHGDGTLVLQNGEKFLGKFKHGVAQGEGTYYRNNGNVQIVVCKNDAFMEVF